MKNLKLRTHYYIPFILVAICYVAQFIIKDYLNNPESFDSIDITETSRQYVLIMGSLAGFSLLIMGFLMFEISSSNLKKIDIDLHEKDEKVKTSWKARIDKENDNRKETVTVFLNCLIITLFGAVVAAIGSNEVPGDTHRALSVFLPSSAFMILSVLFIMIGIARMIDTFHIDKAKRFFSNLVLTLMLFGLIEFAGSIDDATTTVNNTDQICNGQFIALLCGAAVGSFLLYFFRKKRFEDKRFTAYSFICIIISTSIYLYAELFVKEEFPRTGVTNQYVGYLMLIVFSGLVGGALTYLLFDEGISSQIEKRTHRRRNKTVTPSHE